MNTVEKPATKEIKITVMVQFGTDFSFFQI